MDRVLKYRRKAARLRGGGYPDLFNKYLDKTAPHLRAYMQKINPATLQGAAANTNQVRMHFIDDLFHLLQKPTEGRLYDQLALSLRTLHLKEVRQDHDNRHKPDALDKQQLALFLRMDRLISDTRKRVARAVKKLHPVGRDGEPTPDEELMSGALPLSGVKELRAVAERAMASFFRSMRQLAKMFKQVATLEMREHQEETRLALSQLDDVISNYARHAQGAMQTKRAARGNVRSALRV